jgi:hypothetical protein
VIKTKEFEGIPTLSRVFLHPNSKISPSKPFSVSHSSSKSSLPKKLLHLSSSSSSASFSSTPLLKSSPSRQSLSGFPSSSSSSSFSSSSLSLSSSRHHLLDDGISQEFKSILYPLQPTNYYILKQQKNNDLQQTPPSLLNVLKIFLNKHLLLSGSLSSFPFSLINSLGLK